MYYVPEEQEDAELLAERISIRLQHSNSAVVLTTVKVILYLMNYMGSQEIVETMCRKLSPPLGASLPLSDPSTPLTPSHAVTLLSSGYEVQYVALRNILLIIQRRPMVLRNDVKVFFCKYNDPIYVKLAKLEIIYRLANEKNVEQVLAELKECVSPRFTGDPCSLPLADTPRKSTSISFARPCAPSVVSPSRSPPPPTFASPSSSPSSRPRSTTSFRRPSS